MVGGGQLLAQLIALASAVLAIASPLFHKKYIFCGVTESKRNLKNTQKYSQKTPKTQYLLTCF